MSKQVKEQELDETETELSEDLDLNDEELNLEDDSDNGVPTSKDETKTEPEGKKAEPKPEAKAKPDELAKAEQMVQQERANARKAREQAERLEQNQTHLSQQWEAAQKELAELKAAIVAKKEERKALDPETATSAQLIGEIEGLHGQLADQKKRADKLESDLTRAEKAREEAAKADAQLSVQEQILSDVEDTLADTLGGSWEQYRVDAIKEADRRVEVGEVDRPTTIKAGQKLMLLCYKEVKLNSSETKVKTTKVRSDNGRSGVSLPSVKDIKPGSLNSVRDQLSKKPSLWRANAS